MFPPHLDPQTYALSATIVGALIAPDLTINEANSIGNWLILVGDYLLAFAGQKALIQSRQNNNQNLNNQINSSSPSHPFCNICFSKKTLL